MISRISSRTQTILLSAFIASAVVFAFALLHLFNILHLEDRVESESIEHMKNFVDEGKFDRRNIKIIVIPDKELGTAPWGDIDKKHREFFVKLVTAMQTAKAKVLAFDIAFEGPFDKAFSDAISDEANDLKVIVGVDSYENGKADPELPGDVEEPRWGIINVGGSQQYEGAIRSLKLAEESWSTDASGRAALEVIPSLAVRVVSNFYNPPLIPSFDHGHQRLHLYSDASKSNIVRSIPLDRQKDLLIQQANQQDLNTARVYAQAVYDNLQNTQALEKDYRGKIVLVGYENGEKRDVLSGGSRLGVELHATAISNILNNVFIYKLSPLYNYLIILVMALVAALLYTPFGQRLNYKVPIPVPWTALTLPIPLALLVIAALYLLVAFIVYRQTRVYLDVCYHIAALIVSYALVWFVLKKNFPPQSRLETL